VCLIPKVRNSRINRSLFSLINRAYFRNQSNLSKEINAKVEALEEKESSSSGYSYARSHFYVICWFMLKSFGPKRKSLKVKFGQLRVLNSKKPCQTRLSFFRRARKSVELVCEHFFNRFFLDKFSVL
jgi:hypothetical protein